MKCKYQKVLLVIFIIILSVSFIFPQGFVRQAKAAMVAPSSYINSLSISASTISYNQELGGYVCIKANSYDPIEQSFDIYAGPLEPAGSKNYDWQGKDKNGNILSIGFYIFEVAIHYTPGCTWPAYSWYPEQKEFEITGPPPPQSWSFAIISDLHVGQPELDYGEQTWDDETSISDNNISSVKNLERTIELINKDVEQDKKYNLKFVVVSGDFTDSAELSEFEKAKELLDELKIPWVPIMGNHDVWPYYGKKWDVISRKSEMAPEVSNENGTDKYFYDIFAEQYQKLADIFPNWEKQGAPVYNFRTTPVRNSYFDNFEFDFNGYHFIGLDFDDREIEDWPAKGAAAEGNLHDFGDGTWRWFLYNLQEYKVNHQNEYEKVILLAHHPFRKDYWQEFYDFKLYNIGFSDDELTTIHEALVPYRDEVYALFAGHTHQNKDDSKVLLSFRREEGGG